MRKTKIICTIGPASDSEEKLRALIEAGMNVARFNFSHGTHEEHKEKFKRLMRVRREMGKPVATLMDTKGPEIRLRDFEGGKVMLESGKGFTLTTGEVVGDAQRASITYKGLPGDVKRRQHPDRRRPDRAAHRQCHGHRHPLHRRQRRARFQPQGRQCPGRGALHALYQ